MYRYDEMDARFVRERIEEYRGQVARRLAGELSEDEFRPLRLMNGLYLQRHAYMLRISIPYGLLTSEQVRKLGFIAERYDRGYGHVTTRQNLQYNWIRLEDTPDILSHLADVGMHAMQTSGNCVRNVTADPEAGIAADEILDIRPWAEILRQYKELHPEFMFLPRKFKIAISGGASDRAATMVHDIGLRAVRNDAGEVGFRVYVGGGLGRTPRVAEIIAEHLPLSHVVSYVEAILRVYNLHGRRDNKYKARIKILVGALGIEKFREEVDAEWQAIPEAERAVDPQRIADITAMFDHVDFDPDAAGYTGHLARRAGDAAFDRWLTNNVRPGKVAGYHVVYLSLKHRGRAPGDIASHQLYAVADLADRYNAGYIVATYQQNLLFQYVRSQDLEALYDALHEQGLATPNIGTLQDMICCPGLDYCSLANAGSIPVAAAIRERFDDLDEVYDLGPIDIKMSGCINACGHHHVGHIGILGIDKRGVEHYQIALGGSAGRDDSDPAAIAQVLGAAVPQDGVVDALEKVLEVFAERRTGRETFVDVVRRIGVEPFKEHVYG
ncbi:MAG: nitrite/sulfite reductase [Myxococcales bacterium]|nr:nitrite/sulfite reductase [Myxococcales bacterium]MCB9731457.1 nitrite/sulfite reductase [Deltaproteobacteria bacterium]